jgi:uncharacterized protein YdbL (DUF1318 family)
MSESDVKITTNVDETLTGRERSLKNLEKRTPFTKDNQPANRGRKKQLKTVLREANIADSKVQALVGQRLVEAMALGSKEEAVEYLESMRDEDGGYGIFGIVFEVAVDAIKRDGLSAIVQIMRLLFGDKLVTDMNISADINGITINVKDFTKKTDAVEGEVVSDSNNSK